jgi:hypothetical protein
VSRLHGDEKDVELKIVSDGRMDCNELTHVEESTAHAATLKNRFHDVDDSEVLAWIMIIGD